jgi:hypothetical protein
VGMVWLRDAYAQHRAGGWTGDLRVFYRDYVTENAFVARVKSVVTFATWTTEL